MSASLGMMTEAKIWIVTEKMDQAKQLARSMRGEGCRVRLASDAKTLKTTLECGERIDVLVVDDCFGGMENGWIEVFEAAKISDSKPWVVVACGKEDRLGDVFERGAEEAVVVNGDERVLRARTRRLLERKRQRELIAGLDLLDEKTGLPNEKAFVSAKERETKRAARKGDALSIGKIRIDFFEEILAEEGAERTREIETIVAMRLSKSLPRASDFLASTGAGSFAVILPGTGSEGSEVVGRRMLDAIEDIDLPTDVAKVGLRVSASIFFGSIDSQHDETGENIEEALRKAEASGSKGISLLVCKKAHQPWEGDASCQ